MRHLFIVLLACLLGACASTPVPPHNPQMAWVELFTRTGELVMADRLDGKRLDDGRYFQVTPGAHELRIRFDYRVSYGSLWNDPQNRTCYLRVHYHDFKAGQVYRLEGWVLGVEPEARLQDANQQIIADDDQESCMF
jgi:hypothetical protein